MHLTAAADGHRAAAPPPLMAFIIHPCRTCEKYAMTGLNKIEFAISEQSIPVDWNDGDVRKLDRFGNSQCIA